MTASAGTGAIYELLYDPDYRPRRSPTAHIENLEIDGKPTYILKKESTADYYEVDPPTREIWELVDGKRTLADIFSQAKFTDDTLTEKEVRDVVVSFAEEGILESTEPEVPHKRVEVISAFQLDVHILKDSSQSLAGFFRVTRRLIKREELPIALGITALGFVLFYESFAYIFANPRVFDVAGSAILGFFLYQLVVLLPVYAIHELSHAAMCDYYGAKPKEIGTGLYYLAPFFYCDTSDAWRLPRRARIMISVAGPLSTVVISSIFVFWSYLIPSGGFQDVLKIAAFFGYYGSLLNFSPVIETDGYYIMADALNIPNLRDEAFSYIKRGFTSLFRLPRTAVSRDARRGRVVAIFSLVTFAWLAFFGYTTSWLLFFYGKDAYSALVGLVSAAVNARGLDVTTFTVDVATLAYFALYIVGFLIMGAVASKRIRMRGVKLETVHGKKVSAFLPLPSSIKRQLGFSLLAKAKKLAKGYSRSYSVTLEPPLCVAALKLGRADQSLEAIRGEMQRIEQSFRSLHREFISGLRDSSASSVKKRFARETLVGLAGQFPPYERKGAMSTAAHFLKSEEEMMGYLLQSAFGAVWTLELSPGDYKRVRRELFPGLIAEDLSATDLPGEIEQFKKRMVLGSEAIARLSSEVEKESREVYRNPEVYQVTALLEPVKSRLIFVGRTDKVEGSVVWLGGLFLYQAWTGYISRVLDEATLSLKSIRLAPSASITKSKVVTLEDGELERFRKDLDAMDRLAKLAKEAMSSIRSTYESARNFHETLSMLVSDEAFDVGLYKPIIAANGRHLEMVETWIGKFEDEFSRVSAKFSDHLALVAEESAQRASRPKGGLPSRIWKASGDLVLRRETFERRPPEIVSEIKVMFATTRMVYGVLVGSDVVK